MMSSTTDHIYEGRNQTAPPPTDARGPEGGWMPRERRMPPLKRSNADLSVRDALGAAQREGTAWHVPRDARRGPSRRTNPELAHRQRTTEHRPDDRDVDTCDRKGRGTDA
jgi:hypothetical protein